MTLAILPTRQSAKNIEIKPIACRVQAHQSPKGSGGKPEHDKEDGSRNEHRDDRKGRGEITAQKMKRGEQHCVD